MLVVVDIPVAVDAGGAVVELYTRPDGRLAADVRIPAPQD
jgi:hypothetical protein